MDVVGELRTLVAEHPLRERIWALLMRSLVPRKVHPRLAVAASHVAPQRVTRFVTFGHRSNFRLAANSVSVFRLLRPR